jgi:general secretion pathway protein J
MYRNRVIGPRPAPGRPRSAKREGAFTLVELLVALAIFAIVTGFAYRGLNAMLESREALERESRKWRDVALFVGRLERDLGAVLARRATGVSGTPLAPVSSVIESTASPEGLALTRSGSPLQESALAAPQRLAYRLRDGTVERLSWTSVDAAPREEPAAVAVLKRVSGLGFRFLDPRGEWRASWGLPGSAETTPPAAVEVTLTLASGESIVRLIDLPRTP